MAQTSNCSCNSAPCGCASSSGEGCISDLCAPRARFFDGQLIASDDLNAAAEYARSRDLLLGRFVGGWGVYGGLVVDAAPGIQHAKLGGSEQRGPNPQILAGTTVRISPGVAIDALGRQLVQCSPVVLDLAQLAADAGPGAPRTGTPCELFGSGCGGTQNAISLTGTTYFLIAEHTSSAARPVPRFAGSAACDPAPSCEASRYSEGVRFSLVPSLPEGYDFTGCADSIALPDLDGGPDGEDVDAKVRSLYALVDVLNAAFVDGCCARPIVVLGRVLFTSAPGSLAFGLPTSPVYAILDDAYPFRRAVASSALSFRAVLSSALSQEDGRANGPVAVARVSPLDPAQSYTRGCSVNQKQAGIFNVFLSPAIPAHARTVHVTPYDKEPPAVDAPPWETTVVEGEDGQIDIFFRLAGTATDPERFGVTVFFDGQLPGA